MENKDISFNNLYKDISFDNIPKDDDGIDENLFLDVDKEVINKEYLEEVDKFINEYVSDAKNNVMDDSHIDNIEPIVEENKTNINSEMFINSEVKPVNSIQEEKKEVEPKLTVNDEATPVEINNLEKEESNPQEVNSELSVNNEIKPIDNVVNISNSMPLSTDYSADSSSEDSMKKRMLEIKSKNEGSDNYVFSDGLDTVDDNDNKLVALLTNKKFLRIVSVIALILVAIVVIKAFYFGKKVDHYEEFFTEILEKEEEQALVYANDKIDDEILNKMAAEELISCIKTPVDTNNLPLEISNVVNEINNYYNQSNNYFAFGYRDLFTGFTVSYNANQPIFTASAIKAPTDIYIYEMASQGKINLDDTITYTGRYYNTGSGVLKNKPLYTRYTVRTLLEYSTVTSDNAAHNMLMDTFGRENMLNFWQAKGTTSIFTVDNNWGVLNANDSMIYMEELYRFYIENPEYGGALMQNFLNSYPKFITNNGNYKMASKSGWSGSAIHDVSLVFADNPYIVVGLSNLGEGNYPSYFYQVSYLAAKLHEEYWKYKVNTCGNIKQY